MAYQKKPKKSDLTPEIRKEIRDAYRDGLSIYRLAMMYRKTEKQMTVICAGIKPK